MIDYYFLDFLYKNIIMYTLNYISTNKKQIVKKINKFCWKSKTTLILLRKNLFTTTLNIKQKKNYFTFIWIWSHFCLLIIRFRLQTCGYSLGQVDLLTPNHLQHLYKYKYYHQIIVEFCRQSICPCVSFHLVFILIRGVIINS